MTSRGGVCGGGWSWGWGGVLVQTRRRRKGTVTHVPLRRTTLRGPVAAFQGRAGPSRRVERGAPDWLALSRIYL